MYSWKSHNVLKENNKLNQKIPYFYFNISKLLLLQVPTFVCKTREKRQLNYPLSDYSKKILSGFRDEQNIPFYYS